MKSDSSNQSPDAASNWRFTSNDEPSPSTPQSDEYVAAGTSSASLPKADVSWTADGSLGHEKSAGWYMRLVFAVLAAAALMYIVTKDKISVASVIVVGIIFGIVAGRHPHTIAYQLDAAGLHIDDRLYRYGDIRSFSVLDEGGFSSIVFMPLKRFMPLITVYCDPKDEPVVIAALAQRLPMAAHKLDAVDQFMRRIRF